MKKILGIVALMMILWVSTATEIRFYPDVWRLGKWCVLATNIVVDAQDKEIAATDIIIESSMEFVDFVPSKLFPYFLPPKVRGNIIHLVGFTVDKENRMAGSWSIWILYMKPKDTSTTDGNLNLYFTKTWDTTDSNLSVAWWVDVLNRVRNAHYSFGDKNICAHNAANIGWWIVDMTLKDMTKKVNRDHWSRQLLLWKTLIVFSGLLIVFIFLFMYHKISKQWKNK